MHRTHTYAQLIEARLHLRLVCGIRECYGRVRHEGHLLHPVEELAYGTQRVTQVFLTCIGGIGYQE